jgi:hypothetical protein
MILANHGIVSSSGVSSTLSLGLVSAYKAESNANDSFGSNNGTAYGGLTYASGKSGNAFSFNGTTSYVDMGDTFDLGLNSWSYSMWCYQNNTADKIAFSKTRAMSETGRIWTTILSNKLDFNFQPSVFGTIIITSSQNISINTWYHFTFVFDRADKMKIYINGNLETVTNSGLTNNLTSYSAVNYNTSSPFRLGSYTAADNVTPLPSWNGLIDEVGIWNKALTTTEITELYASGSGKFYPY